MTARGGDPVVDRAKPAANDAAMMQSGTGYRPLAEVVVGVGDRWGGHQQRRGDRDDNAPGP